MKQHLTPLRRGDTLGVIAPSRPILYIKKQLQATKRFFEEYGYHVQFSKHITAHQYYSAGTVEQRLDDLHDMFLNNTIKAIICATGGISSNQLLSGVDYELIKKHPKIFLGYSDITTLLLGIFSQTGVPTFHGPDMEEIWNLSPHARTFLLSLLTASEKQYLYPKAMSVIRPGKARGTLLGGNLMLMNSLLAGDYTPSYDKAIVFWEDLGKSPAMLHFQLQAMKLSGKFEKISGMVIGHLSGCKDKKYPKDNRKIKDIVLEVTRGYTFPIISVEYFGHDIKNFYTFPLGVEAIFDTSKKLFTVASPFLR